MTRSKMFTVGIPTYVGGSSLVKTVASIARSAQKVPCQIIVAVDGNPLDADTKQQLKKFNAKVFYSPKRGGQVARLNDIIRLTTTEFLVFTQDDVLFTPNTLRALQQTFDRHPATTMTAGWAEQLPPQTLLERIIYRGTVMSRELAIKAYQGDHYLVAVGRCLAFRTNSLKNTVLPTQVICSDAYLYFLNRKRHGRFVLSDKARYKIRSPQTIREHTKQSRKFALLKTEMWRFLQLDIDQEQPVSRQHQFSVVIQSLRDSPWLTTLYLFLFTYTRIKAISFVHHAPTVLWETDASTKKI
jgi:glycosyltransferase involved in cell wall biosynthesis